MQNRKNRNIIIFSLIILSIYLIPLGIDGQDSPAELRGLWVTAWDLTSPEKIDSLLVFAEEHKITQIFAHTRYRGDALYTPNRIFDTYPNSEPISYILDNSKGFDPLAYLIENSKDKEIEEHAWVTVFVATPRIMDNVSTEHLYYKQRDWFTRDFMSIEMSYESYEGAYLDPGIPEVQDYLLNVFLDIITNYQVNGIQLDYIRYPDSQFGYAPKAIETYYNNSMKNQFDLWKQEQVTRFMRRFYAEAKYRNPDLIVTAAVISDLHKARKNYSQNWTEWLDEGIIDYAYTMAYALEDNILEQELYSYHKYRNRIVVGLRAWTDERNPYSTERILSKMQIVRDFKFAGFALFSYTGLQEKNNGLIWQSPYPYKAVTTSLPKNKIFGYLSNHTNNPLSNMEVTLHSENSFKTTKTDANGFFFFQDLADGEYWLTSEKGINVIFSDYINISKSHRSTIKRYNLRFPQPRKEKYLTEEKK